MITIPATLLTYAGPPVLGAFIGYLTNKVAIRMLFRPLRSWHVFGLRVPMTPGVIPSKRRELAENIGEMVGRHLLTSKDIGAALSEEPFQEHLSSVINQHLDDLLNRDFGPAKTLVPDRFRAYFKVAVKVLDYQIREAVSRYLHSDEFAAAVSAMVSAQVDSFGARPLNELISAEERQGFYGFIDSLVSDLLNGPQIEEWLAVYLQKSFQQSAEEGRSIADHLPDPLLELIVETIRRRSPDILRHLAMMLAEPPVRERIIRVVRGGVDHFIESLGPLGIMAGSFMNMSALEDKIREYLTDKEEEIVTWLQNAEVQDRFSAVLVEQTEKFLDTPLAELLDRVDDEQMETICRETAVQILGILRAKGVGEALSAMLRDNLEEMLEHGNLSTAALAEKLLTGEKTAAMKEMVAGEAVALLRSRSVRKLLGRMSNNLLDALLNRPVGILGKLLPVGVRTGLADYAVITANRMLIREVPGLVDSLNIRQMVAEKVDSLDLMELERLLLSIMEEQFKYINLFGALLGFLIGLLNLLVPRLM